jgi:hypothetical protein
MKGYGHIFKCMILGLVFFNSSCEVIIQPNDSQQRPTEIFEFLWNDIHNRYSYFEEKNIDWVAVRENFRPMVQDGMDQYELFEVLGEMLAELEDGHVNLLSSFDRSRNWSWYEDFPALYDEQLVLDRYLETNYRIIGPFRAQTVQGMLYVNYRSFEREVTDAHMDEIIRLMQFHEGLIIDVRSNGGGSLQNAFNIASRFTAEQLRYGSIRFKAGPGRADFTPWSALNISSHNGARYPGKVAVLTNRKSYSSTTFFAQMMRTLPQARLFGDRTGGGGGTPAYAELSNGWTYRFSASQAIDLDEQHLEFGVPVDEEVLQLREGNSDTDLIIEAAVAWLKM